MSLTRRDFIRGAAAAAAWPLAAAAQQDALGGPLFQHGVASGDPLADRVMLWTRVTAPPTRSATGPIEVAWQVAADEALTRIVSRGTAQARPERDFTVKVDAPGLEPGTTYYYAFTAGGQRSPIGRTRTLPASGGDRLRLAVASCSNYPAGYFNAYRCIANRADLDVVIHLGDYIYEFADGVFGDTKAIGRAPLAPGEAATLEEYRLRYATYRSDPDLQEAHRQHPFIVVWDDHEIADNATAQGTDRHDPATRGDWATRLAAAYRAYLEWLPVRETADAGATGIRLYRSFQIGDLADLVMLDARGLRDRQVSAATAPEFAEERRTMLGAAQEAWLFERLGASMQRGSRWRLIGQQVLFTPLLPTGPPLSLDMWDGYPAARRRVTDFLAQQRIGDLAILTGDLHSAWGLDLSQAPPSGPAAPLGVELVTPAVSSPPLFTDATLRARAPLLRQFAPHVRYLDGDGNGYLLLDITRARLQAEFYFVPNVRVRSAEESRAQTLVCEHGANRFA